ncbi:hypothetical protein RclHR1_00220042 [Rhizophagus clarus]|uniref:Jacalin-type lectin domain-containing protein n=1 Tax=Rhizophagus clarus TaxID=94130 RepID=A0A2Z6RN52_9GLOM|nr:hypothetical protein RclHR1_00220042 [Rhizophagus clarus]GES84585.1 hypothetical protein GLOIN_2v1838075 [Rhizophagus clarus]
MYLWDERMKDFISILQCEHVKEEIIGTQNNDGSFDILSDQITDELAIVATENISSSIHISNERMKKFNTKIWNTFITIAYCINVLRKHKSNWTTQNDKARAWLHIQIGDEKLENDILESCKKVIVEKAFNNIKKESSWSSALESILKYKIEDVSSVFIILRSKTTPETAKKIVDDQKSNGSIKLNKIVSDQINISSDKIQSFIQTYGVSEKLKTVSKDVWETALSLRYLTIASQSQVRHKEQSEKAKKYLIEELKDKKLAEELLSISEKIIVEQSVKKEREVAAATVKTSTTTEKAKKIVSCQKDDGLIELTDNVSKELDVKSNDSLRSSIKTCFGNRLPENTKLLDTAITLSFLRKTSSSELKDKFEKAEKYLKAQLKNDEKLFKELLEKTDTVVVEHATKKVIKEKADRSVVEIIQEAVTEKESMKVIETQNNDGSYKKISDQITEKLGITIIENFSSSIRIPDERVKKFDTKVWNTFITIAYCNKILGKWIVQIEKARAWLHAQIEDEKLENKILESCEKTIEKISSKKKELSADKLIANKVFLTIPLLSTLVILFFLEYEGYDKMIEENIFTQINDRAKEIISKEYINEIDNQIKNLQPIKKLLLEYLVIQKDKRTIHIKSLVENCNSFFQDLLKNENIIYLIPFTITFAIVHLTILRESIKLKMPNFGIDELKKIISQYQVHFTNSFDRFFMWRMNQIETETLISNDSNSKSLFSFRANGEVKDNISNKTVNYIAKSSDKLVFTRVFDLIKLRMLNEAKAKLMEMFLPIFSLDKFIPNNKPSCEPFKISSFWIGPYGVDTFPDGQHNLDDNRGLFYNISEDDPGVITKIKLRHGSLIDSMQIFYEDGRIGRIGNGTGGREHTISDLDESSYIIAANLKFGGGLLCSIEFFFNDGKTTGALGINPNVCKIIGEIRIGPFGNHNEFRLSGIIGGGGKMHDRNHGENVAHIAFQFQYVK